MYTDEETSSSESDDEENYEEDTWDKISKLNQEEMDFIHDISSVGPFVTFAYRYPQTKHWNEPQKYATVRSLFYKFVDKETLDLIHPKEHHYDYDGEGNFMLDKDLVDTLFMYSERWCYYHAVNDIFWVASCIVQFSCI